MKVLFWNWMYVFCYFAAVVYVFVIHSVSYVLFELVYIGTVIIYDKKYIDMKF